MKRRAEDAGVQKNHTESFFKAVSDGDLTAVAGLFLLMQVDPNCKDEYGSTPLQYASINGHIGVVRYLIETAKVDVAVRNGYGCTPLHQASKMGHLAVVQYLVETAKADVETKTNEGCTSLHYASYKGRVAVVQYFVETAKADVEAKTHRGSTPLHYASKKGQVAVVQYLVETAKADVEARDNDGQTPIDVAFNDDIRELLETATTDSAEAAALADVAVCAASADFAALSHEQLGALISAMGGPFQRYGAALVRLGPTGAVVARHLLDGTLEDMLLEIGVNRMHVQAVVQRFQDFLPPAPAPGAGPREHPRGAPAARREEEETARQQPAANDAAVIAAVHHALNDPGETDVELSNIPFNLLEHWTEGFAEGRLLGSGGFGNVYRGEYMLKRGPPMVYGAVAVKRVSQQLFGLGTNFYQQIAQDGALASMKREISVLRAFRHPNVIKLLGYHMPTGERPDFSCMCLVYELASNGSLDGWLRDDAKAARLDWRLRAGIAFGVASALNYLHSHDRGHPAFHRDVKSANIGLTVDFVPKLMDCGLAKYIPSTGTGSLTVFTHVAGAFGSPGYVCSQHVNTGVYDAKSEVFAFGIVLAELYGGRLQNADGVSIDDEAVEDGTIVPDARVTAAPGDLVVRWKELCFNCIKRYSKRIATMLPVLRELKELASTAGVGASDGAAATEDELNRLRKELEAFRLEKTVEERLRREENERNKRQCAVCYDDECTLATGVECPRGHFLCDGCFRGGNLTSQLSVESRGDFKRHGAHLVCQWCQPGERHVFEDSEIVPHLGPEGFKLYQRAREEVAAAAAAVETELRVRGEVAAAAAASQAEERVARRRRHIAENILTLHCPRANCRQAILDFDGCLAITCANCRCGFCGWCLMDCGCDAHDHVKACPQAPRHQRGGYYGTMDEFNSTHRERRRALVIKYITEEVEEADRNAVRQAIAQDLREIGIAPLCTIVYDESSCVC